MNAVETETPSEPHPMSEEVKREVETSRLMTSLVNKLNEVRWEKDELEKQVAYLLKRVSDLENGSA